jgi:hypothetical protein
MHRSTVCVAIILGLSGCQNSDRYANSPGVQANCTFDGNCESSRCGWGNEEIVVHAPPQRVCVTTPAGTSQGVTSTPQEANDNSPSGPIANQTVPGTMAFPQAVPGMLTSPQSIPGTMSFPQQAFNFGVQPGMAYGTPFAAPGLGMNGISEATVTTKQPTGIGFAFTTINIPFPWIKVIPVQHPAETTIKYSGKQSQMQAAGFAGVPFGVGSGSLSGVPGSFVQGQVVGPPIAQGLAVGSQMVQSQAVSPCLPCPSSPPAPNAIPSAITPERVQALTKKIEELEAALKAQDAASNVLPIPRLVPAKIPQEGK